MENEKKRGRKKKVVDVVATRVKNPDLVLKNHKHITNKASKLFIKKGYHRTSMRDISDATGMAVGNIYNYIKKKEDVLCLVFDVFHRSLGEYLEKQGVYDIEDPQEQLRAIICRLLENCENFRDEVVFMYREMWLLPKAYKEKFINKELEIILMLERIIKKGVDQGCFHVEHPFYAASMITYQLSIEPLRSWTFRGRYSSEEIRNMTADYILIPIIK